MKKLTNFGLTSEFENDKEILDSYLDYAALTKDEDKVHFKELPDMVDIALWDNTDTKVILVRGWEYNAEDYPMDRYTPIGFEVVQKIHGYDLKSRIMSLKYMRRDTPMIGGESENLYWGLFEEEIENMEYKSYIPSIKSSGTADFNKEQTIVEWIDCNSLDGYFPSDHFNNLLNPYTKNQGYAVSGSNYNYFPSPYNESMNKNSIFFSENEDEIHGSMILNFDGKGETAKVLKQLAVNLGNEDWKTGTTIPNSTSSTLGWDKIAPAAQCCWMYCVDEKYKDNPIFGQGQWYFPTLGELAYVFARYNAINKTLEQINNVINGSTIQLTENVYLYSVSSSSNETAFDLDLMNGVINSNPSSSLRRDRFSNVRAFCLI